VGLLYSLFGLNVPTFGYRLIAGQSFQSCSEDASLSTVDTDKDLAMATKTNTGLGMSYLDLIYNIHLKKE
jgi:hypothetical protein